MNLEKKRIFGGIIFLVLIAIIILALNPINAQQTNSYYCAERTTSGAWCQNVPFNEVDTNYNYASTSCDSTSYCQTVTCVNAVEGSCRPNVPQRVCESDGGVPDSRGRDEIPQCQLGCCYLGESASYVTQTKCTSLSALHGVEEAEFNGNINDPFQCISSAAPEARGACVFDDGFVRNCEVLTNEECQQRDAASSSDTSVEFREGVLCTASYLETTCGPTERTTIVEGRDEVFFVDSCGNLANVYDASKIDPVVQDYWDEMINAEDSCTLNPSLSNADVCGNCNYLEGSIGKAYERGDDMFPQAPDYGNYICADLSCKSGDFVDEFRERFNRNPEHGESWCSTTATPGNEYQPGSEQFKVGCFYGESTTERGDPFRQTVCVESEIPVEGETEGFKVANFRANKWQDCVLQDNQNDCEDIQQRDCVWREGETLGLIQASEDNGYPLVVNDEGELVPYEEIHGDREGGVKRGEGAACLPKYPVGLWFWEANTTRQQTSQQSAADLCMVASDNCIVKVSRAIRGALRCEENCHCIGLNPGDRVIGNRELDNEWSEERNQMCTMIGDCGAIENYRGNEGYWEIEDLVSWEVVEE